MPITWQNVNQSDVSTAWRAMDSAQRSINGAFDGLTNQITKSEDIQAKNNLAERANNTQSYLDKVAELGKTPDQLQAAMQNGAIDQLKASFGPNIDHAAVRGAAEGLLDQRYKQVRQATEFTNFMTDEKTAPIMDKFKSAMATGDKEGMEKYRAAYAAVPGARHAADLEIFARDMNHQNMVWSEEKKGWVRSQEKHVQDIAKSKADIAYQSGMLANSQANTAIQSRLASVQEKNFQLTMQDHISKQLSDKFDQLQKTGSNTMDSPMAQKTMVDLVKEMYPNDQKVRESLLAGIAQAGTHRIPLMGRDGKPMLDASGKPMSTGIPVNDVANAIMASKDDRTFLGRWMNNDTGQGTGVLKAALSSADNPETVNRALATLGTKQILQGSIGRLTKQYNASIDANTVGDTVPNPMGMPAPSPARQILSDVAGDSDRPPVQAPTAKAAPVQALTAPAKTAPATLSIEAKAKREYTELNQGKRTDLSPEVKAFRKQQAEAESKAEEEANKKRLAAELQRELRKARNLQ